MCRSVLLPISVVPPIFVRNLFVNIDQQNKETRREISVSRRAFCFSASLKRGVMIRYSPVAHIS